MQYFHCNSFSSNKCKNCNHLFSIFTVIQCNFGSAVFHCKFCNYSLQKFLHSDHCKICNYLLLLIAVSHYMPWFTAIQNELQWFHCNSTAIICSVLDLYVLPKHYIIGLLLHYYDSKIFVKINVFCRSLCPFTLSKVKLLECT